MARITYDAKIRERAESLRKIGKTYAEIRKELPVAKSTLSLWLGEKYKGVFDRKAQLIHLHKIRKLAAAILHSRKTERIAQATEDGRRDARAVPLKNIAVLKALISMLYWAEGTKCEPGSAVTFTNTDPELAVLFITLLRKCFGITEAKMRVRLHLHHYHNRRKSIEFWSRLLGVPREKFGKIYIKKRSIRKKFRRNFMGICFIIYHDARVRREILATAHEIGKIITLVPSAGIEPAFFPPQGNVLSIERRRVRTA